MNHPSELHFPALAQPAGGETLAVAPGVAWIRMPLPYALDHINLWLLDDGERLVAVDSGIGLDDVRAHWQSILARDGRALAAVVVTHHHPDHLGLASWLAARDRVPVIMTQGEFLAGHAIVAQTPGMCIADMVEQFRRNGLDEARLAALAERGNAYRRGVPDIPSSFRRIFDGDVLRIGGNAWRVIVGYGHAPEHASLYCEALGVLISGDMLLPRISTNISVYAATPDDDPLGWFLESLNRFKDLPDDTLVLPSHGRPFRGIRARIEQLETHHRDRCDELLGVLRSPATAGEILSTLFPRELDTHQVMFAMGEAIAHLNYLVNRNRARRLTGSDGMVRFERTA